MASSEKKASSAKPSVVMTFGMSFRPFQGRYMRVHNQAAALVRDGFEVILLAWDRECEGPEEEVVSGIRVIRMPLAARVGSGPANLLRILRFNRRVRRTIKELKPDVVHCYNLDAIWATWRAGRAVGAACVLDLCEPNYFAMWRGWKAFLLRPINWLERQLATRYDLLCVHNDYQVDKFTAYGHRNLIQVGSYPPAKFQPEGERTFEKNPLVIGRFGTIYEDNGIEELLETFKILQARRERGEVRQSFHLKIAGRVLESYAPTYEALCRPFGDELSCSGAFAAEDIPALYAQVDLATVLYRRTKWFKPITPTKLFDALSCGVPIIASDMGEVREILEDSEAGLIVDESDPEAVADAIISLAGQPELRRQMAVNGLTTSRQKYSWSCYEERFLLKYRELMEDR